GKAGNAAPLKMLFITALPDDLGEGSKMLQIEEEQTRLIRAIGALEATGDKKPKIVIEFLENASLTELDKALTARHHDMVHISGHGGFNPNDKKGVLYFENEDGDEAKITGAQLGKVLEKHGCVKLLVLSACETAIAGAEGGVTEQAAEYGVPTIVAMRFAVTDEGAKVFTTALYTHLAKGDSVTQAVAYAREALHARVAKQRQNAPNSIHIAEWFTPVVYQNQYVAGLIDAREPYLLPTDFYPQSSFLKTKQSRLIGEGFIGRKGYLIRMRHAFRAGKHVTLQGLGGLGKTTLAEAFAHNYDNHSHEVVIFRNAHQINEKHILDHLNKRFAKTNPDLAAQVQEILESPQATPTDKLQVLIDNYLCHRRIILIFDNFEDVQQTEGGELQRAIGSAALSEFMRHLGENTPPDCHLIFTTRYAIPDLADTVINISLGKMGYAEQYRLLNYAKDLRGIPLADRDAVYKRLDGHPRGYEFLEALVKKDKTFTWAQVDKVETDVFENLLLEKVYERLGDEEQHLFQVAAVFIAATPVAAIAHVLEKDEAAVKTALQGLGDWSLLFLDAKSGTFDVHRL
ncbi:MAG: CHAT domain-containing protein, partial [Saprospiraceae bacterium]|nr:CHAT domain-containing protein [Saprospiraceae bacterium]